MTGRLRAGTVAALVAAVLVLGALGARALLTGDRAACEAHGGRVVPAGAVWQTAPDGTIRQTPTYECAVP